MNKNNPLHSDRRIFFLQFIDMLPAMQIMFFTIFLVSIPISSLHAMSCAGAVSGSENKML